MCVSQSGGRVAATIKRAEKVVEFEQQIVANLERHSVVCRLRDSADELLDSDIHAAFFDDGLAALLHLLAPATVN